MADKLYALTEDSFNRLQAQMQDYARRQRNGRPRYRARYPLGGSASCPSRNEIHIFHVVGSPTTGTFNATYTVLGSAETSTFVSTATSTEVATALATHTNISSSDISVTGGPFPNATMQIEFISSLAAKAVPLPTLNWGSLTGGSGVGVFVSRPQNGYPGDASTT